MAYSLPILQYLASATVSPENATSPPLTALILAPTRELAIQVTDHLKKTAQFMRVKVRFLSTVSHTSSNSHGSKIAPIVGGMSIQKQRRVVQQTLHILVATPGRLWELMGEVRRVLLVLERETHFELGFRTCSATPTNSLPGY